MRKGKNEFEFYYESVEERTEHLKKMLLEEDFVCTRVDGTLAENNLRAVFKIKSDKPIYFA